MNKHNAKHLKKRVSEELMPVAWHPMVEFFKMIEYFACQKMRKKKQNRFLLSIAFSAHQQYTIWKYGDIFVHKDLMEFKSLYEICLIFCTKMS